MSLSAGELKRRNDSVRQQRMRGRGFGYYQGIHSKTGMVLDDAGKPIIDPITNQPQKAAPEKLPALNLLQMEGEVKNILGSVGYAFLHKDGHKDENGDPTDIFIARNEFQHFLKEHMKKIDGAPIKEQTFENSTTLKAFFSPKELQVKGKEKELAAYQERAMDLYKAAIKEEQKSPAFRNAVFLKAIESRKGVKFDKKQGMHIGGPSGGGKSKARDSVIGMLMEEEKAKQQAQGRMPEADYVNHFVSVDGGIDRDTSQVRNLLFSAVLAKNYKLAEDLHSASKGASVKKLVRDAVVVSGKDLHLVIPDTYTDPLKQYGRKVFKKLDKNGYEQSFILVKPDQEQTCVSGNRRACMKQGSKAVTEPNMDMDKKPEGKVYEPELFKTGARSSHLASHVFKSSVKGRTFEIDNDVQYYMRDKNSPTGYTLCSAQKYDADIITNKRLFTAFVDFNNNILTQQLKNLLKEHTGPANFNRLYLEKIIKEIEAAPSFEKKCAIIEAELSNKNKALPEELRKPLESLQRPILDYEEWTKDVPIIVNDNEVLVKNYEVQLWQASGSKTPLGPQWTKEMEKRFGVQISETTDPKLKEKMGKEAKNSQDVATDPQKKTVENAVLNHNTVGFSDLPLTAKGNERPTSLSSKDKEEGAALLTSYRNHSTRTYNNTRDIVMPRNAPPPRPGKGPSTTN